MKFSKIFLASLISFFVVNTSTAQLVVDNTITIEELVNNVLLGDGVEATNITFNGQDASEVNVQLGFFLSQGSNIPIDSGLVMATGNVIVAEGPNDSDGDSAPTVFPSPVIDPDIESIISPFSVNDIAILEFDFTVNSDSVKFNYVFASEEYDEFVCGNFNDAFGFFLSGTDIDGPFEDGAINIALIPGTEIPVAINTVNSGEVGLNGTRATCEASSPDWDQNSEFFLSYDIDTGDFDSEPGDTQFDGFTTVLTAEAAITCGGEYHIKMVIADAGDGGLDSGVFLEAGSFSAFGEVFASFSPVFGEDGGSVTQEGFDSIAVAGCTDPLIELIRPTGAEFDTLYFALGGAAIESEDGSPGSGDYWVPEGFIESFPEGVDTVNFTIETINPNITDTLDILLIIYFTGCGGVLDSSIVEIPIAPPPNFDIFAEDQNLICPADTPFVYGPTTSEGGLLPYIYDWFDLEPVEDDQDRMFSAPEDQQEYTVRVTDQCEFRYDTTSFLVINSFPLPFGVDIDQPADPTCPNEPVSFQSTATNGSPPYGYIWTDSRNNNYPGLDNIVASDINPAAEAFMPTLDVFLTAIDSCGREASDEVQITYPDFDSLSVSFTPLFDNCPETPVLLESIVEGGAGDFTYNWMIDGESSFTDGSISSTSNTFIDAGSGFNTFTLEVQDRCRRAGHDMFLRLDDDGMPVFSGFDSHDQTIPYIKLDPLPNIITPNGDGQNEVFVVPGIDAFENASVLIYDRWGKLIYENNSYDAGVPGEATISQGFSADGFSDGTYLYIINIDSGECVAQGNLSVVRGNE